MALRSTSDCTPGVADKGQKEAVELTVAAASGQIDKGAATEFFRQHLKNREDTGRVRLVHIRLLLTGRIRDRT
jgi:hypothetical protein